MSSVSRAHKLRSRSSTVSSSLPHLLILLIPRSSQTGTTTSTFHSAWDSTSPPPSRSARCTDAQCSIPEFLTGARYVASDSLTPSYLASYDISSTSLFSDPKYTTLRANRSVREGALVIRLETLDRRTCETVDWTSTPPAVGEAAVWTCTVSGEGEEGELREMEGVKGWRRTHRHRVYDALRTGYGKEPNMNDCPTFLVVHGEFHLPD